MSDMTDEIVERAKVFLTEEPNWTAPMWLPHVAINGLEPDEWYRRMYHSRSRTILGRCVWPRSDP